MEGGGGQTPFMEEEATVGRGVTKDSWNRLALVNSAHVDPRQPAARAGGGGTHFDGGGRPLVGPGLWRGVAGGGWAPGRG